MNAPTQYTILDVLLYVFDQIKDLETRAAIEATRFTQPHLWEAETVRCALQLVSESGGSGLAEDQICNAIVADARKARSFEEPTVDFSSLSQMLGAEKVVKEGSPARVELAALIRAAPEGSIRTGAPLLANAAAWGWHSVDSELVPVARGGGTPGDLRPALPSEGAYDLETPTTLYHGRSEEEVPFGVVRILAAREGVPLASIVRVMVFEARTHRWTIEVPKAAIFQDGIPAGKISYYYIFGTEPDVLHWFSRQQVTEILKDIPPSFSEERRRVQALLALLSSDGEERS